VCRSAIERLIDQTAEDIDLDHLESFLTGLTDSFEKLLLATADLSELTNIKADLRRQFRKAQLPSDATG
jgi:hypothetical protein